MGMFMLNQIRQQQCQSLKSRALTGVIKIHEIRTRYNWTNTEIERDMLMQLNPER